MAKMSIRPQMFVEKYICPPNDKYRSPSLVIGYRGVKVYQVGSTKNNKTMSNYNTATE